MLELSFCRCFCGCFSSGSGFSFGSSLGSLFSFDLGESLRTELCLLFLNSLGSSNLTFDGTASLHFVEEFHDTSLLHQVTNSVRGLSTSGEPLESLFLIELDFGGLGVGVVETDLFDKAIVACLTAVDNDYAVDRVVTLTKARKTDSGCHFNLFKYCLGDEPAETGLFNCFGQI